MPLTPAEDRLVGSIDLLLTAFSVLGLLVLVLLAVMGNYRPEGMLATIKILAAVWAILGLIFVPISLVLICFRYQKKDNWLRLALVVAYPIGVVWLLVCYVHV